jgi:hypothetical protein
MSFWLVISSGSFVALYCFGHKLVIGRLKHDIRLAVIDWVSKSMEDPKS